MTCGKPIRDRSGEPLPGKTCTLDVDANGWHLGNCAIVYDFGHTGRLADFKRVMAQASPDEPETPVPSK